MTRIAAIVFLIFVGLAQSADPPFKPTIVIADGESMPAVDLIDSFARQARIVIDRSTVPSSVKVSLHIELPFWQALQKVADATGHQIVIEGKGERIVLVKKNPFVRPAPNFSGPFRVAVKSISAKSDFEAGRTSYDVQLEMNWEPRIAVFRTSGLAASASKHIGTAETGKASVTGSRQTLALRFDGIDRKTAQWQSLSGSVTVTAAEKMLRLSFDDLTAKQPTKTVEKVTVTLVKWEKIDDFWEARMELTYPPGKPEFESFEAECWLRDNACRLVSPDRSKSFDAKDQLVRITPTGAVIDYRFHEDNKKGIKPGSGGWHLEIDTPSPLKEFAVPYELKGIPLP